MEITLDKIDKTEGLIKVKLNEDDYQPGVTQKVKEYSKQANIKGFRPGKVPAGMIRKMYGKSILLEEINRLVSEKLNGFLRESDLQFLGEPMPKEEDFESIDLDNQKDFEFTYNVGFAEEFDLKIDDKLKVDRHAIKIDDKVIDETVENLQRQFGDMATPDVSEDKDTVYGEIKSKDGEINKEISIDLNDTEKAATKKLTGVKVDDEVELDPKKLYKDSHKLHHQLDISHEEFDALKGKLNFTVKGINRQIPAEINQDLFDKTFGEGTVKDEKEFREKVAESVGQSFKAEEEQYFNFQIRDLLIEKAKINLPDEFLKRWLIKTNDQITEEVLKEEYEQYSKELKWSLIRNKIVKDQDFKVENEEVIEEAKNLIRQQFGQAGLIGQMDDKLDMFAQNYLQAENGENYMKVHNQVQNNKVFDYLKETLTVKDKKVTMDEFRKL
ncbi:trigger factor [Marinoscillum furvescens]|uniref:Trigger factor n=1 Tax=Marinoscillum furvescens DSM 4134 TaxID=1122208 RepID=A0A3D9KYD1_MARFU|nr:trigger factor [Marinoscillum furvescens]RED92619.1 trigger factor [Marinoscillum furvescens DSM 4134]